MLENLHHLSLPSSNFSGLIPRALGNLSMLLYLDLSDNNLQGRIPDALGNLISLAQLSLSINNLEGRIPDALGNLIYLSQLSLSNNNLKGSIPDTLWNLTGLSYLDLYDNQLQGEFPQPSETLKQGNLSLPHLEILDLSSNKFMGRLPNLSSLRYLLLRDNMFNGTFPKTIGSLSNLSSNHLEGLISEVHLFNLSNLFFLGLSDNSNLTVRISSSWNPPFQLGVLLLAQCNLGPYFPTWLKKHKQLLILDISNNKISDTIPDWLWDNFAECELLYASNNQIYGALPTFISNLKLSLVDFSCNKLNDTVPLLSPTIRHIDLSRNNFSGTSTNFCKNVTLKFLDLSDNAFSTEISQACFLQLTSLSYLNLANNNFSGKMPNSIDWACNVASLHLRNNSFTGEILSSLKYCGNLFILDLGGNKFTGQIPDWLGESVPELGVLSLTSNKFYGSLPSSLCHLTKLQVLDISMNKISGPIPKCLKNFTLLSSKLDSKKIDCRFYEPLEVEAIDWTFDSACIMWKGKEAEYVNTLRFLTFIDLSSNNLIGEIPPEVTSLVGFLALNLSGNNLVGSIPYDVGNLELLNFLDLSKNNLSGHIPPTLSQLSHLGVLDLSFNNLSGKIPWDAHLQTFNDSTFIGNFELCGPPLVSKPCPEDGLLKTQPEFANNLEHEDIFISMGFYISMEFGFIVAFWGVVLTVFLNKWCGIIFRKMVMSIIDWLYDKGFLS